MAAETTRQSGATPANGELSGEIFGGLAAMLVALPSAIAFGLVVYAPLGGDAAALGALAGIIGAITLGIIAAVFGGAPGIITAPCAPAAAVMGALTGYLASLDAKVVDPALIPLLLVITALLSGVLQLLYGLMGGGNIIKFIPFPVVAGYLSGVGLLIFTGQLPKFLGMPKGAKFFDALAHPALWQPPALIVGGLSILAMVFSNRITRRVPAPIIALACGVGAYFGLSTVYPGLITLDQNPFVIGPIQSENGPGFFQAMVDRWSVAGQLNVPLFEAILIPALTLSLLLSIDTLKTGVILDALTRSRHHANRELIGQGLGNIAAAFTGGMPGAGTMGATLVNVTSGGRTRLSGILNGVFALITFLVLGDLVAWIPLAALAGILMVVGIRMIDRETFHLLRQKATVLDFLVILAVVVTAVGVDLMSAAGVGMGFAILLFLRGQIRSSVVRRILLGNQIFSKKRRLPDEMAVLEEHGGQTVVVELQGDLFFGTADQLFSEMQPLLSRCKFLILHMKRVQSMDFTAAHRLEQIETQLGDQGGRLVLANLPRSMSYGQGFQEYLRQVRFLGDDHTIRVFDDLDAALEWVEDQTIRAAALNRPPEEKPMDLEEMHILSRLSAEEIRLLRQCVEEHHYEQGHKLFSKDDPGDALYLIRTGAVKIMLPLEDGKSHHLVTFGKGDFFGDMSFLDNSPRSADAVTSTDCTLYVLSRKAFDRVAENAPHLAQQVFVGLGHVLADRLRQANVEIRMLQEA